MIPMVRFPALFDDENPDELDTEADVDPSPNAR
jgi:hypothetical protein